MPKVAVKKAAATRVLNHIRAQHKAWLDSGSDGPALVAGWDWLGTGAAPYAIVWEEGPYEWAILATGGGYSEFGAKVDPIPDVPGVFAEPITGWALGLYQD